VPAGAFEEEVSGPRPNARVRRAWLRRVEVEYQSAALTQHLTLWLIQAGVSPDLIRAGLAIVDDELAHAELAHGVAAASGAEEAPVIDRASLGLERTDEPLEHDIVRACVGPLCLGETVAVPLFRALRERCAVPIARRALTRVLRDEVRHRDFAWSLLEWMLALPQAPALRTLIARELPAMMASVRASYSAEPGGRRDDRRSGDERAWGLMPASEYHAILERSFERDLAPRFARLGLDARAAWRCSNFR
jgi:hypothetical protein